MRYYYKQMRQRVSVWNSQIDECNHVQMNPRYSEVKATIEAAVRVSDLDDKADTGRVFLAAMEWVKYLEFDAMKQFTKNGGDAKAGFEVSQLEFVQKKFEILQTTVDYMEKFVGQFVRKNPNAKQTCERLMGDLYKEYSEYDWHFSSLKRNFEKKGSATKTKDKAFFDVMNILNQTSSESPKIPDSVCSAAGSIFSCIYCLKEPKTGWVKYSRTQYSNYQKRLKPALR